ncbi:hypothetical protein HK102_011725, partial [Quaeritorhiza haematococci]
MIEKYPKVLFFYYAAAKSSFNDPNSSCEDTVSFCDSGLSLTANEVRDNFSSYLRLKLLNIASFAFKRLAREEHDGYIETNAELDHLKSAMKYAEEYIRFAAPDVSGLKEVIAEAFQLTLMIQNNSHFKDTRKLRGWLDEMERKFRNADLIASYMDPEPRGAIDDIALRSSCNWVVVDMILTNKKALIRWARRFRVEWRQQEEDDLDITVKAPRHGVVRIVPEQELQDDFEIDHSVFTKVHAVALFHFRSFCGKESADFKKCSGCSKARYCDANCQKAHWK